MPAGRVVGGSREATIGSLRAVLDRRRRRRRSADALAAAVAAADGTGRPLFSGLARQPWPDDPVGRLWRACELAREHRGDSHVAACIAAGLGPVAMNVLTELWVGMPLGSYTATRGWSADQIDADGRNASARPGLLDGDQLTCRRPLVATSSRRRPTPWSNRSSTPWDRGSTPRRATRRVVGTLRRRPRLFPPDVFKRAAG